MDMRIYGGVRASDRPGEAVEDGSRSLSCPSRVAVPPNGLELSCPAEAGRTRDSTPGRQAIQAAPKAPPAGSASASC